MRVASHHFVSLYCLETNPGVCPPSKGRDYTRCDTLEVILDCVNAPSILKILFMSKELEKDMAESAVDSNEDLSEETEDLEPLEPDDGGKKVTHILALLSDLGH